ncbi:MAG: hypothetical protein PVJ57_06285 [Phycisphaerae bacterium]|jgi:hypothetical protein
MAIVEAEFESEKELEDWVKGEFGTFLPVSVLLDGFYVSTGSGKKGVPDGFAFDFDGRMWYVIECELLKHEVWPHIAEQITRFVVAMKNPATLRVVRDRLFEHVMGTQSTADVARTLGCVPERLLQEMELFVEGIPPRFVIFIDKTNRDLQDMATALDSPTLVFRVQKFLVDGRPEYHSPDRNLPTFATEPDTSTGNEVTEYGVIELLGGGELAGEVGRFKCYRLADGSVIHMKKSKYHERQNYYWYGIGPSALEHFDEFGVTHVVFVMGNYGFVRVPLGTLTEFLKHTKATCHADGSVRHYHVLITHDAEPELFWSNEVPKYCLAEYFTPFEQ